VVAVRNQYGVCEADPASTSCFSKRSGRMTHHEAQVVFLPWDGPWKKAGA
jgi:hypothetical protein